MQGSELFSSKSNTHLQIIRRNDRNHHRQSVVCRARGFASEARFCTTGAGGLLRRPPLICSGDPTVSMLPSLYSDQILTSAVSVRSSSSDVFGAEQWQRQTRVFLHCPQKIAQAMRCFMFKCASLSASSTFPVRLPALLYRRSQRLGALPVFSGTQRIHRLPLCRSNSRRGYECKWGEDARDA